jgi:hypothetical protein
VSLIRLYSDLCSARVQFDFQKNSRDSSSAHSATTNAFRQFARIYALNKREMRLHVTSFVALQATDEVPLYIR